MNSNIFGLAKHIDVGVCREDKKSNIKFFHGDFEKKEAIKLKRQSNFLALRDPLTAIYLAFCNKLLRKREILTFFYPISDQNAPRRN